MRILALVLVLAAACGGPSRSTYARHPGAPVAFDRATANPEALAVADKVLEAHGGAAAWEKAKQIRWKSQILRDGKPAAGGEQAWDRWNARHWGQLDRGEGNNPVAVMYDIYGDFVAGYQLMSSGNRQAIPKGDATQMMKVAREAWTRDTTSMFAAFLLHEPGAKIEYIGLVKNEAGVEFHDLKLTFDPKDTARTGLLVHVYADKATNVVGRVEIENAAGEKYAYELTNFQAVNGLKLPTERKNLGSGEIITATDIKVSEPDDMLFAAPTLL